jgi:SAM-dependent methyltransferase
MTQRRQMPASELQIQGDWDAYPLRQAWPMTPDNIFVFQRLANAPVEATAAGARGPLLEVAAAEAVHACRLNKGGLEAFVVEPSPAMLSRARERMAEHGATVTLIRGIAETLPFPDHAFDRVLCDSALDHLADPERGICEMARVTRPDGRVVLTFVNYGGVTVRLSRLLYRMGRGLRLLPPEAENEKLFWDSPVPYEHNFECTVANVSDMCRSYLELDSAYGISIGWMLPGWGPLLERFPRLRDLMPRLDRIAHRHPALADFVVSVWRPRPRALWPVDDYRVRPNNPVYQRLLPREAAFWEKANYETFFAGAHDVTTRDRNLAYTGNAERTWIEDLAARGPFRSVAVLGCDGGQAETEWLRAGGSERLDVYELSSGVIAKVRARLGPLAAGVRFVPTDLNFVELPAGAYDLIWSSDCLHSITNLEHLYAQVARALRPGGLFAFQSYIGEPRLQYDASRLARVNAVLRTVPARFRHVETVVPPDVAWNMSPFQAIRSHDVLPLAHAHFTVVHEAHAGRLFPLSTMLDMRAIARDDPALLARLRQAEDDARTDPVMRPCSAYAVFCTRP